jgi:rhodanese-related sulfurtransferase
MKNVILISILFIFSVAGLNAVESIFKTINVTEAKTIIDNNKDNPYFIIIDVRTPEEFTGSHIDKAKNIDFYAKDFKEQINKLDKNKKYLIYCRSGHRSGNAMEIMKKNNFKEVYNVSGGINDWNLKNLPVVK